MATALKETPVATAEWSDVTTESPYLQRVLDDVERSTTPRQEPAQHPSPATRRTPRLFAFD